MLAAIDRADDRRGGKTLAGLHVDDGETLGVGRLAHLAETGHRREERPGIGMAAVVEDVAGGPGLHHVAAIHHHGPIGDLRHHAHVVGDEEHRHVLLFLQLLDQVKDLALDRHVEGRRRLVGDQELRLGGERHGDHHALTHAAGELMGIFVETGAGVGDAHLLEQPHRLGARRRARQAEMADERFGDLPADREDRIEAGHRLLEDHRHVATANGAHLRLRERREIAPHQADPPLDPAHPRRQEAHHRQRRDALAGSALADDRQGLARGDLEGDVAHHRRPTSVGEKRDAQPLDGENRPGRARIGGRIGLRHGHGDVLRRRVSHRRAHGFQGVAKEADGRPSASRAASRSAMRRSISLRSSMPPGLPRVGIVSATCR